MDDIKPLRVVILDDHVTPYRVPLFSRLWHERSVDVTVLFTHRRLPNRKWIVSQKLDFKHRFLSGVLIPLRSQAYQDETRHVVINPTLFWHLIKLRPDVVVGYAFSVPAWIVFIYARLTGIPYISWSTDTPQTRQELSRIQQAVRRLIVPRAAGCITPSELGRQMFVSYGAPPDNISVIVQAADLEKFSPPHPGQRTGEKRLHKILLYVGHLSERKGIRYLLSALPTIRKAIPEVRLLLVGEGSLQSELEKYVLEHNLSDHVHFAGHVQQDDLRHIYASADIFLFTTMGDRFGMVIAEAAASGLPLVTSKYAAASYEFVRHGENGFIIDPREPDALVHAVIEVLSDDSRRQQMARISRQIAEEKNPDMAASKFIEALHRAASRH